MFRNGVIGLLTWFFLSVAPAAGALTEEQRCLLALAQMASGHITDINLLLGSYAENYAGVLKAAGWSPGEVKEFDSALEKLQRGVLRELDLNTAKSGIDKNSTMGEEVTNRESLQDALNAWDSFQEGDHLNFFCAMAPGCNFIDPRTRAMNMAAAENFDVRDISKMPKGKNLPSKPTPLVTAGQSIIVGPPRHQGQAPSHTATAVVHEILHHENIRLFSDWIVANQQIALARKKAGMLGAWRLPATDKHYDRFVRYDEDGRVVIDERFFDLVGESYCYDGERVAHSILHHGDASQDYANYTQTAYEAIRAATGEAFLKEMDVPGDFALFYRGRQLRNEMRQTIETAKKLK